MDYSFINDAKMVDDFAVDYIHSTVSFPDWLENAYKDNIQKLAENARAENKTFDNNGTYSLIGISVNRQEARSGIRRRIYHLHLRPSEYFRFVFPNTYSDAKLFDHDRGEITYRDKLGIHKTKLQIDNFHLWNIHYRVATNLILLTRDNLAS